MKNLAIALIVGCLAYPDWWTTTDIYRYETMAVWPQAETITAGELAEAIWDSPVTTVMEIDAISVDIISIDSEWVDSETRTEIVPPWDTDGGLLK